MYHSHAAVCFFPPENAVLPQKQFARWTNCDFGFEVFSLSPFFDFDIHFIFILICYTGKISHKIKPGTFFITVYATKVRAEECGHEELNKCSKSLQVLKSATDLSFAPKREELAELCPDLEAGLRCIRSYTRRCMTLPQRQQFMKIYKGTDDVIRDLCREGDYQNEFLKHAACLRTVRPQHKKCEEKYQETMLSLKTPKANQTMNNEQQTEQNTNDDVRKVCW
jgi:hypothetical protein